MDQCPACGYNAWTCVDHFPYPPPPLERFVDVENKLTNEHRARIDAAIESLEREMPQVRLHICLVRLLPRTDVRECGFWLLNASIPRDEDEGQRRPWSALLVIDLATSSASATVGYGLDRFVSDEALRGALGAAQQAWEQADFPAGILKFVQQLHAVLRAAHKPAQRAAARGQIPPPAPPAQPPAPTPPRTRHPEV